MFSQSKKTNGPMGKILVAMLDEAGENNASLSGCNQVYSLPTSLLLLNQIVLPASSFFSTPSAHKTCAQALRISR